MATGLTEALRQARAALAPHSDHLPGGTVQELDDLLADFDRHRIRIAFYGEVKAGKSTLLNAVAGSMLSPVGFEPLTSVPVRVTYGAATTWYFAGQRLHGCADLERVLRERASSPEPTDVPGSDATVETNLDLLELGGQVDLLDTPGVGSDARFDAVAAEALRPLDAVVLVVRYPALFTQFTRDLVQHLDPQITKLFVVWNLDSACAGLGSVELTRHAQALRQHLSDAQEMFLVDALAGLQASQDGNPGGRAASGLTHFSEALTRFVSSSARDLTAVREAAKVAQNYLRAARGRLTDRRTELEHAVADAHKRLAAVQDAAAAGAADARARFSHFEASLARAADQHRQACHRTEAEFQQAIRHTVWQWVRSADLAMLEAAVSGLADRYTEAIDQAGLDASRAAHQATEAFGAHVESPPRAPSALTVAPLAPDDRHEQATVGPLRLLRRAAWRSWYLPGVSTLVQTRIAEDRTAQSGWLAQLSAAAHRAASDTLAERLRAVAEQAEADTQRITDETGLAARTTELEDVSTHVPLVSHQLERVAAIGDRAREMARAPASR